jgi:anti-sigma B factor antagonist
MSFQITTREAGDIVVMIAVGSLTLSDGRTQLRDVIHVFAGNGRRKFVLHVADVNSIDSYGVGELARCYGVVRQAGGELKLVRVSEKVRSVLEVTQLHTLFEMHADERSALKSFGQRT